MSGCKLPKMAFGSLNFFFPLLRVLIKMDLRSFRGGCFQTRRGLYVSDVFVLTGRCCVLFYLYIKLKCVFRFSSRSFLSFPRIPYWCARSSNWGDLLPMTVEGGKTEE